jgi:KipI family sensor histidine kinase inhibitor
MAFRMSEFGVPRCVPLGQSALVFEGEFETTFDMQRRLWVMQRVASSFAGVIESVVGLNNLTLIYDRGRSTFERLRASMLESWENLDEAALAPGAVIEIPVRYGERFGPDLAAVARACSMREEAVIEAHLKGEYVVWFVGFAPGFAYLGTLDLALQRARRDRPRERVPAGSVAIAEAFTAVYPSDSPGGWHVIGHTDMRLFDAQRAGEASLQLGDRVRFQRVE